MPGRLLSARLAAKFSRRIPAIDNLEKYEKNACANQFRFAG